MEILHASGGRFFDEHGRTLLLRGANLGGDCKLPVPRRPGSAPQTLADELYDYRGASFVGRPFPEDEARSHFARLSRWGLRFARFLVTWEALEHDGPGRYDLEYVDYVDRMAALAGEYGVSLFIDPHQDVWSRWTGGDGAPAWTLEAVGFDLRRLHSSGAAIVREELDRVPEHMYWPTNYNRLACATMFTLFFGGDVFAPSLRIDGSNAREFLQTRYLDAMRVLAVKLAARPNVVGFDSLNEPSEGFIGLKDLERLEHAMSYTGPMPTPFEAMASGSGIPTMVDLWAVRGIGQKPVRKVPLGERGISAWKEGAMCPWRREGVWDIEGESAVLRKPDHFSRANGRELHFERDFLKPFVRRFGEAVCGRGNGTKPVRAYTLFIEGVPNVASVPWSDSDSEATGIAGAVNACHWYDSLTLFMKMWTRCFFGYDPESRSFPIGPKAVRRYFRVALGRWKERGIREMGNLPTLIGEFGIPYDMNGAKAFKNGKYGLHEKALAENYDALDELFLSATVWNYTASNRHSSGDGWNGEDLSIWNRDDAERGRTETGQAEDSGGRALAGFVRPYAAAVAGAPVAQRWKKGVFDFSYEPDHAIGAPTEILVPGFCFPRGFELELDGCGCSSTENGGCTLLRLSPTVGRDRCSIRIRPSGRA